MLIEDFMVLIIIYLLLKMQNVRINNIPIFDTSKKRLIFSLALLFGIQKRLYENSSTK